MPCSSKSIPRRHSSAESKRGLTFSAADSRGRTSRWRGRRSRTFPNVRFGFMSKSRGSEGAPHGLNRTRPAGGAGPPRGCRVVSATANDPGGHVVASAKWPRGSLVVYGVYSLLKNLRIIVVDSASDVSVVGWVVMAPVDPPRGLIELVVGDFCDLLLCRRLCLFLIHFLRHGSNPPCGVSSNDRLDCNCLSKHQNAANGLLNQQLYKCTMSTSGVSVH